MINNYIKPKTLKEAYEILINNSKSSILGGGIYIRFSSLEIDTLIDISGLDLDFIEDNKEYVEIGAMTSFRSLEKSKLLKKYYGELFLDGLKDIVGVQLRNGATIGGSIYPKYGFSDLITILLILDCKLVLYKNGEVDLDKFLDGNYANDILVKIKLKKENIITSYQALRNSSGDYSILNTATAKVGNEFRIAIGAREGVAKRASHAEGFLKNKGKIGKKDFLYLGELVGNEISFSSNYLASSEYRKDISKVLVKRSVMEVME